MSGSVEYIRLFMPVSMYNVIRRFDCITLLQKKRRIRWENKRNVTKKTFFAQPVYNRKLKHTAHNSRTG